MADDAPKQQMMKLELLRAYWPEEDHRIDEGSIFETDPDKALELVETGVAKRAPAGAVVTAEFDFKKV